MKAPGDIDLSTLSRDEKLRLIDVIEEKQRRARENREAYAPNSGQRPIHTSTSRIRAVFSGNGAGKTAMSVNEAFWALKGYNPVTEDLTAVPCKVIVVLDKPEKIQDVWLPEIKKWFNITEDNLRKNGKPYYSEIILENGSSLSFMFHLQEPMAFESIEADFFVFDEPPPRGVFLALMRGGRRKGRKARFLIVGTPIAASWLRKDLYDPWTRGELPDTECFRFGTSVNQQNLADGYLEDFKRHLSEKEQRIRLHGEFFDLDGLALAHLFDRNTHLVARKDYVHDDSSPCVVVIDPHPNKKHVACLITCDRNGYLYYLKEFASKSVPRQFARELKAMYQGYRVIDIVCDSLGATPMSGGEGNKSFIEVLQAEGVSVRSTRYEDKNDESWLMRIQEVLTVPEKANNFAQKLPKLRILADNRGIIADIENVTWLKIKNMDEYKPKLDISNRDYLACLKYGLASNLHYKRTSAKLYKRTKPVTAYGQRPGSKQR
jgi:hypothetical protein